MKILLVTGSLGYRGTAKALYGYAMILMQNHDVRVWGCDEASSDDEYVTTLREKGIVVYVGCACLNDALAFTPDIVNLHRPGVTRQRDLDVLIPFKNKGARCIETNVFGCVDPTINGIVDTSIQISFWDLWQWSKWTGPNYPVRGVYCPNPIDCSAHVRISDPERAEVRKAWGIPSVARIIGRIGKTDWPALERPLLSILASDDNAYVVHVEDYSNRLPNSLMSHPRVRSIPRLRGTRELSRFYSSCDVMVNMCLIGESFGYVNAEAMLCGTPVIALSTPLHCNAQSEMLEPGVCGLTIARPAALGEAYRYLFADQDRYDQMAGKCRTSIVSRYSYEACAPLLEAIMSDRMDVVNDAVRYDVKEVLAKAVGTYGVFVRILFGSYYTPFACGIVRMLKTNCRWILDLIKRIVR